MGENKPWNDFKLTDTEIDIIIASRAATQAQYKVKRPGA